MANSDSGYQQIAGDYPLGGGTLLPSSSTDGEPLAFNAHTPRPVVVDPGQPAGDFTVDYVKITQQSAAYNAAAKTANAQANPVEFLRNWTQQSEPSTTSRSSQPAAQLGSAIPLAGAAISRGLAFLDSQAGLPPLVDVYFQIPLGGTVAAKYHVLIQNGVCLVLVYDTRFTTGFQYVPPVLPEHRLRVTAPTLGVDVDCCSLGLQFGIGCFECVVLLIPESRKET